MAEGREFPFGGLTRFLFLPDINILKLTQATRLSQLGSQRSNLEIYSSFTPNGQRNRRVSLGQQLRLSSSAELMLLS
jgi:hypothetical protein